MVQEVFMKKNRIAAGVVLLMITVSFTVWAGGKQEVLTVPETTAEAREIAGEGMEEIGSLPAAEAGPLVLTVEKAVEYALENNLGLKGEAIKLGIKKRTADYAWNRFIPTVQASGTMARMNTEQTTYDFSSGFTPVELPQWSVSAGLDMSLTLNLAIAQGIRATQIDYERGLISYEQAKRKVERDVRKGFYNLLLMRENRELMVENISAAERRYEQAQINYQNGMVPELTVLSAQVAWENMKPQLKAMDLGYRQALQGFKLSLGLDLDREVDLEGTIDAERVEVDSARLIEEYLADRLDVQAMTGTIIAMENQLKATKLQVYTPQLILGFNMDPSFSGDPWRDPWFGGDAEWNQRSGMFRASLAMSLDGLLPFSQTQIGIQELEDSIKQTRIGLLQMIEGAKMEIDGTVRQLEKSRDTIETLQLNVERARRAYEMAEEAYNAGSRELLEVQNAEIELKSAQLEVLKEKYTYLSALIDLEYQLNTKIEELAVK
jgi:outer membrane protein TolC